MSSLTTTTQCESVIWMYHYDVFIDDHNSMWECDMNVTLWCLHWRPQLNVRVWYECIIMMSSLTTTTQCESVIWMYHYDVFIDDHNSMWECDMNVSLWCLHWRPQLNVRVWYECIIMMSSLTTTTQCESVIWMYHYDVFIDDHNSMWECDMNVSLWCLHWRPQLNVRVWYECIIMMSSLTTTTQCESVIWMYHYDVFIDDHNSMWECDMNVTLWCLHWRPQLNVRVWYECNIMMSSLTTTTQCESVIWMYHYDVFIDDHNSIWECDMNVTLWCLHWRPQLNVRVWYECIIMMSSLTTTTQCESVIWMYHYDVFIDDHNSMWECDMNVSLWCLHWRPQLNVRVWYECIIMMSSLTTTTQCESVIWMYHYDVFIDDHNSMWECDMNVSLWCLHWRPQLNVRVWYECIIMMSSLTTTTQCESVIWMYHYDVFIDDHNSMWECDMNVSLWCLHWRPQLNVRVWHECNIMMSSLTTTTQCESVIWM